jgi:hypothetical protein
MQPLPRSERRHLAGPPGSYSDTPLTLPRDLRQLAGTGLLLVARLVVGPSGVAESEQAMAMAVQAYERRSRPPIAAASRRSVGGVR